MAEQRNSSGRELDFLKKLSMEELEALLRSSGDPDDVETLFDAVAEEVVKRETKTPTGRLPDADAAWEQFQAAVNTPERAEPPPGLGDDPEDPEDGFEAGLPLARKNRRPARLFALRAAQIAAVMAVTVALSLSLMVGVQAAGVDVFGALARWTSDTFQFETRSAEQARCGALHDAIQSALDEQGIAGAFVPTWYPEGFELETIRAEENVMGSFIHAEFANEAGKSFLIAIERYEQAELVDSTVFQIDEGSVEEYWSHGKIYYVFSNVGSTAAAWTDEITMQIIWGQLDRDSIKSMIDSIGG